MPKKRRPPPRPIVVRRHDRAGRRYYVNRDTGRRVSKDAWENNLERRRRAKKKRPRPVVVERHPLGPEGASPFPAGVTERGVPTRELVEFYDEDDVPYEEVEDSEDYEEGTGA